MSADGAGGETAPYSQNHIDGASVDGGAGRITVIAGATRSVGIARQEVFKPVLSVPSFRDQAEAANDTVCGLVAGVFKADLDHDTRAAGQLWTGQVFVNGWYAGGVETPFSGYGKSGYGREKGREALWNCVQTKNVAVKLKGRA